MPRVRESLPSFGDWWHQYRATLRPEAEAYLAPVVQPLLERCDDPEIAPGVVSKSHLVSLLDILLELKVDGECLAGACFYHRLASNGIAPDALPQQPAAAVKIARELRRVDALEARYTPDAEGDSAEGLRRLLMALVGDVRVVLVALADRLVRLRAVGHAAPAVQQDYARLVQAIHGPLANRLGIWQLKWELEDRVFRYLKPDIYQRIARLLDERRADRERYIQQLVKVIQGHLRDAGIQGEVHGRPKHIYSIWRKMQRKGVGFHELFDVRAIRILVGDVATCYATLGLLHAHWRPVPGEFDDYIANPKGNNYQSLHTAVFGPESKPVEMQIRTPEMHEHAELGVAAHWRYKEGHKHDPTYQRKLNWMRQLLEAGGDDADNALLDEFGANAGSDERVYVLTPRAEVVDLQAGSTVLDFAYHVHTDVGHRCRGAKVNGRIVPLTYRVSNGEQVEILTARNLDPSRDWLIGRLGYLRSSRARGKVRQWFKLKDRDRNLAEGRELLEKELRKLAVATVDLAPIVLRHKLRDVDSLYVAVATGEVTVGQIAAGLEALGRPEDTEILPLARSPQTRRRAKDDVIIDGVGNLMTTLARCCRPLPGDNIAGYITRVRGVSVHRDDCRNLLRLAANEPARLLEVKWGHTARDRYQAELRISAYDRQGLVRDIGSLLLACHSDLLTIQSKVDQRTAEAAVSLSIRVSDFEHLSHVLNRLNALPNVIDARRVG